MHNTIEDGGPAFPIPRMVYERFPLCEIGPESQIRPEHGGMSLRDWFAGMALQGCLANPEYGGSNAQLAQVCFAVADAMLAARKEDAE